MWYFTWILAIGFAVMLAIVGAMWLEAQDDADAAKR
ncbi:MAG: cytochrome bd-I oxidase subunit CydX [Candidatus Accumulibacter sp.]|jgi:cyd operon protein YbgT|nr:cytochrome bd-I oxidase subunit CydX [Accumulibacter sp.]